MKQLLEYFSRLGSKYQLRFSGQEILTNCILGFDGVNRKLLVLRNDYRDYVIDLNTVSRFAVKKYYGSIQANALNTTSLDHYLEKLVVEVNFHNNTAVDIPFYETTVSTLGELPQLETKARRWNTLLSKLLKKRRYHAK